MCIKNAYTPWIWLFLVLTPLFSFSVLNYPTWKHKNVIGFDSVSLLQTNGRTIQLSSFDKAKGFIIVFTCNHCPFAQLYSERLNKLSQKFSPLGIPLIAVNSMDSLLYEDENLANMAIKSLDEKFSFPYLKDGNQELAKLFNAENTPQVFVVWKTGREFEIAYQGTIDDNGKEPTLVKNPFVELAVNALLNNKRVQIPYTESFGCKIIYRKPKF